MNVPIITLRGQGGASVRIDRFPVVLGRSIPGAPIQPDCDVAALDPKALVSKQHARLEWHEGERLHAVDMGSTNGTTLDGRRLEPQRPAPVSPGAILRIADVELVIDWEPTTAAAPEPAGAPASGDVGPVGGEPLVGAAAGGRDRPPVPGSPLAGAGSEAGSEPPAGGPDDRAPSDAAASAPAASYGAPPPPFGAPPPPPPPPFGAPPPPPPPPFGAPPPPPPPFGTPSPPFGSPTPRPPFGSPLPPPPPPPPFGAPAPPPPPPPFGQPEIPGPRPEGGGPPEAPSPFAPPPPPGPWGPPPAPPPGSPSSPFGAPPPGGLSPFPAPPAAGEPAFPPGGSGVPPAFARSGAPPATPLGAPLDPAEGAVQDPPADEPAAPLAAPPAGPPPLPPPPLGAAIGGSPDGPPPLPLPPVDAAPFGIAPGGSPPALPAIPGGEPLGETRGLPSLPDVSEDAPASPDDDLPPFLRSPLPPWPAPPGVARREDEPAGVDAAAPPDAGAGLEPDAVEGGALEEPPAVDALPEVVPIDELPPGEAPTPVDALAPVDEPGQVDALAPVDELAAAVEASSGDDLAPVGDVAPAAAASLVDEATVDDVALPEALETAGGLDDAADAAEELPIVAPASPPPVPETAPLDTASMLEALDDPDTRELVVIAGRRPRVRTSSGWVELGGEVTLDGWNALWRAISARTGAPVQPPSGHIAHLGPRGVVAEAMMPPLSDDPVLHVRRRPPEATLDEWIAAGRVDGDSGALFDAILNRRGVLVIGDRGSGRTSLLEALATSTSPGERVAACERLPQLRIPGALRLRLDPANPAPALGAARAVMAEWLVLDDPTPSAVGAAAIEAEANRAALLVSARAVDAESWLLQVARSISYEVADAPDFVRSVLAVVVRVELGPDGRPRARVERS